MAGRSRPRRTGAAPRSARARSAVSCARCATRTCRRHCCRPFCATIISSLHGGAWTACWARCRRLAAAHENQPAGDTMNQAARYPSLEGKRVFVTGGGTGIGEAIVAALSAQGAIVAFVDIADAPSTALCERIAAAGHPAPVFRHCDIADIPVLQRTMAELAAQLGDFDVLVNNAANDQRHNIETVS